MGEANIRAPWTQRGTCRRGACPVQKEKAVSSVHALPQSRSQPSKHDLWAVGRPRVLSAKRTRLLILILMLVVFFVFTCMVFSLLLAVFGAALLRYYGDSSYFSCREDGAVTSPPRSSSSLCIYTQIVVDVGSWVPPQAAT